MVLGLKRALYRFLLFGLLGMLLEVFAMAWQVGQAGNWSLRGASSPWMLPIYGLIGIVLDPIARPMKRRRIPLPLRAVVYVVLIFAVEYVSGRILLHFGINRRDVDNMHTVWDYGWARFNLHGQIALEMAPTWYVLALFLEFLYRRVDLCATALALRLNAATLPEKHAAAAGHKRGCGETQSESTAGSDGPQIGS